MAQEEVNRSHSKSIACTFDKEIFWLNRISVKHFWFEVMKILLSSCLSFATVYENFGVNVEGEWRGVW